MFDRQKYSVSADFQVPDYDLEAGLRIGAVDPSTKGKATHSIQIDFTNKNIPQASLIGLAKYVLICLNSSGMIMNMFVFIHECSLYSLGLRQ